LAEAQFKEAPKLGSKENKPRSDITYKTFKLHSDQKEIVEAALSLAKRKGGTTVDTVALEYIAQEFMGTQTGFITLKAALVAEYKKSGGSEDFLGVVAGLLDSIGEPQGYSTSVSFEAKK